MQPPPTLKPVGPNTARSAVTPVDTHRINLSSLLRLRWLAFAGQMASVLWTYDQMALPLPLSWMITAILIGAASNLALHVWSRMARTVPGWSVAAVMIFDGALLTGLLALSGGPSNPFSTLYLVNVVLAAVLLPGTSAWAVALFSLAAFAALFPLHRMAEQSALRTPGHAEMMRLHLEGMWVAFALATLVIVYFVRKVRVALAERESELDRATRIRVKHEHLTSLATLAAGAAHELGTPLSTIAVAVREAEHALRQTGDLARLPEVREDLVLARSQVERCRNILKQMSAAAGHSMGEKIITVDVLDCLRDVLSGLPKSHAVELHSPILDEGDPGPTIQAPPQAIAIALSGLVKNALDAQPSTTPPEISIDLHDQEVVILITDTGPGMAPEVLERAGEPFFTTKGPDAGTGLGIFLARELLEQLGGKLTLSSTVGKGTEVRVLLPKASGIRMPRSAAA